MSTEKLLQELDAANKQLEGCMKNFRAKRKELDSIETTLVEAREAVRKAQEKLETYKLEQVGETSIADDKEKEIAIYKEKMPGLLRSIEHEKPIPFKTITDLETLPEWPKRRNN